jgi:glycosyltransferase involved in cell wall biosynthesis
MNILNVTPTYYSKNSVIGGGEKGVIYIADSLAQAGKSKEGNLKSVDILSFGVHSKEINFKEISLTLCPYEINFSNPELYNYLKNKFKYYDVVIIHQCLSPEGIYFASIARLLNKITVGFDHGSGVALELHGRPDQAKVYDLFVAQSEFGAASFKELNVEYIVIKGPMPELQIPINISDVDSKKKFTSVGRILPHKGFEDLITAAPKNSEIVIIGNLYDVDYYNYLKEKATSLGKNVRFELSLDDEERISEVISSAAYVQTSKHIDYRGTFHAKPELLGLATLEALVLGKRSFVSKAGALNELADVHGCESYDSLDELSMQLESIANNRSESLNQIEVIESTLGIYGQSRFGAQLYTKILNLYLKNSFK